MQKRWHQREQSLEWWDSEIFTCFVLRDTPKINLRESVCVSKLAVWRKCTLLVLQTEKLLWLVTIGWSVQGAQRCTLSHKFLSSLFVGWLLNVQATVFVHILFASACYLEKVSINMRWFWLPAHAINEFQKQWQTTLLLGGWGGGGVGGGGGVCFVFHSLSQCFSSFFFLMISWVNVSCLFGRLLTLEAENL